jgi:hypothetical protein
MKDCIINPETGRHIKTMSVKARKLIKGGMVDIKYIDCPPKKSKLPKIPKPPKQPKPPKPTKSGDKYILNPATGRMVLRSGVLGKKLAMMEEKELPVIQNMFIPLASSRSSKSSSSSSSGPKRGILFSKRRGKSAGNTPSSSSASSNYTSSSSSSSGPKRGILFSKRRTKSAGNSPSVDVIYKERVKRQSPDTLTNKLMGNSNSPLFKKK